MDLSITDAADIERIRGNLTEFERILGDRAAPLDAASWAGTLSFNVKELLEIVARLAAPAFVPSGTGWPVP